MHVGSMELLLIVNKIEIASFLEALVYVISYSCYKYKFWPLIIIQFLISAISLRYHIQCFFLGKF